MGAITTLSTAQFLDSIAPELEQAFSKRPDFGSVGIVCHFHNGEIVRVEVAHSTQKKMPDKKTH